MRATNLLPPYGREGWSSFKKLETEQHRMVDSKPFYGVIVNSLGKPVVSNDKCHLALTV